MDSSQWQMSVKAMTHSLIEASLRGDVRRVSKIAIEQKLTALTEYLDKAERETVGRICGS